METTFRINTKELDRKFLNTLKSLFGKKKIEITVTDIIEDETEFLLSDPANKSHLMKAIEEVKQNKNLVRFSGKEFEEYSKSLSRK